MLRIHVLASGSKGNASVVENTDSGKSIVIDCGLCKRDFFARLNDSGIDYRDLAAIIITHDHGDHTKGLGVVMRALDKLGHAIPVYALPSVREHSKDIRNIASLSAMRNLDLNNATEVAGICVEPFATSHDSHGSCGFRFSTPQDALGFVTDSGVLPQEALAALRNVRILCIESNHDPAMLKNGAYPTYLKARVSGSFGHLSNEQACEAVCGLSWSGLEHVVAMHVSRENNTYRLPRIALEKALESCGSSACVHVACQDMSLSV